MKKLLLCVFLGLVAAFFTTRFYDTALDPQLAFFRRAAQVSDAWETQMRGSEGHPCYIFAGGSDVRMSIDPAVLWEEYGVRSVNAGNNANMGMHCNASLALAHARPGDTVVLCLYSNLMPGYDLLPCGLKFTFERRGWDMFRDGLIPLNLRTAADLFQGEAGAWCVYFSKLAFRPDQMFQYDKGARLHPSGWVEVLTRKMGYAYPPRYACPANLTPFATPNDELKEYIAKVKKAAGKKGAKLAVYLPRHLESTSLRAVGAMYALSYTRLGIPVIKDETFGIEPSNFYFADTNLHLTGEGTKLNSRILGKALCTPVFWTQEELVRYLNSLGWNADGSRAMPYPLW